MNRRVIPWILRKPRSGVFFCVDRYFVFVLLYALGVKVGKGCRFGGFPIVRMTEGSEIRIGDGVLINSRVYGNAATMTHRTVMTTSRKGAVIDLGAEVGLSGVSIAASTEVEIGSRSLIGSGTVMWDTDFHPLNPADRRRHPTEKARSAPIRIGSDVFVGAKSVILKGVTIGSGSVIGAGSVVTSSIPEMTVAGGNPARVIRHVSENGDDIAQRS